MCDDAAANELREEHERMSDVKLLAVLVSDEYRHEVRQPAKSARRTARRTRGRCGAHHFDRLAKRSTNDLLLAAA